MPAVIFLDESGDLGWSFALPYRAGGSSRYLTICAAKISHKERHLPSRIIKDLYSKFNWNTKNEKKWAHMRHDEKLFFAYKVLRYLERFNSIQCYAVTVYKPHVPAYIQKDPNTLYNYLIKEMLLDEMAKHDRVEFFPDQRSLKVTSGDSLSDYMQTQLYFEKRVATRLMTKPRDSASDRGIQFVDMLSGLVQQHFEDQNSEPFRLLEKKITLKQYYFPKVYSLEPIPPEVVLI